MHIYIYMYSNDLGLGVLGLGAPQPKAARLRRPKANGGSAIASTPAWKAPTRASCSTSLARAWRVLGTRLSPAVRGFAAPRGAAAAGASAAVSHDITAEKKHGGVVLVSGGVHFEIHRKWGALERKTRPTTSDVAPNHPTKRSLVDSGNHTRSGQILWVDSDICFAAHMCLLNSCNPK